jgi:16S rRNA (uracil1498-N3)-methyltransferase
MSQRFFSEKPITSHHVQLEASEAHHLLHVMRGKPGEHVVLFDGSGAEFTAQIESIGRREVSLVVLQRHAVDRELSTRVTLSVALPRGDRQEWLVEKAVELGVARLIPWQTQRGVASPGTQTVQRLMRTVIEASKQCGRNRLMQIARPIDMLQQLVAPSSDLRLLAHTDPSIPAIADVWTQLSPRISHGIEIGIGPEGGFTSDEIARAIEHGWMLVGLGPRTLRTESAAIAMAALIGGWASAHPPRRLGGTGGSPTSAHYQLALVDKPPVPPSLE